MQPRATACLSTVSLVSQVASRKCTVSHSFAGRAFLCFFSFSPRRRLHWARSPGWAVRATTEDATSLRRHFHQSDFFFRTCNLSPGEMVDSWDHDFLRCLFPASNRRCRTSFFGRSSLLPVIFLRLRIASRFKSVLAV